MNAEDYRKVLKNMIDRIDDPGLLNELLKWIKSICKEWRRIHGQ